MDNFTEKYNNAFYTVFGEMPEYELRELADWDSAASMTVISAIEDTFDIMMDIDDILVFNSYEAGIVIVKKYLTQE